MNFVQRLRKKIADAKTKDPTLSNWKIVFAAINGMVRVSLARVYLRKANKIGRMVSVYGKPLVRNAGVMDLEDEVRVWSNTVRAKLITGGKGKLYIGKNSRINGAHIYAGELVSIGRNVRIAPYTIILDSDFHSVDNHFSEGTTSPVVIEDDVWIATRATILKGVRIGRGAVVATGAVVTKNVAPYTLVAGVPARVVRKLSGDLQQDNSD